MKALNSSSPVVALEGTLFDAFLGEGEDGLGLGVVGFVAEIFGDVGVGEGVETQTQMSQRSVVIGLTGLGVQTQSLRQVVH